MTKPAKRPYQVRYAFSLIELLVVIAVIALLLAILLPSLSRARSQAKRTACATNLKQIANGWHMYFNESGDRFPQWVSININFGGRQGAQGGYGGNPNANPPTAPIPKILNPYLGLDPVIYDDAEVFRCPADKGGGIAPEAYFLTFGNSYGTNPLLIGQNQIYTQSFGPCQPVMQQINEHLPKLNRSRISNESKLILMGDAGWVNTWHPGSSQKIEWHDQPRSHNLAFLDGHVNFLRLSKGLHITSFYTVMPFHNLIHATEACQQEVEDE